MKGVAFALALPAVVGAVWATIAAFQMGMWLSRHGVAVNWFWFRVLIPRYVGQYKTMTEARDGKPGPLYAHFVIPINVALLFAVAVVIVAVWGK